MNKATELIKAMLSLGSAMGTTTSELTERIDQLNKDHATVLRDMAQVRLEQLRHEEAQRY